MNDADVILADKDPSKTAEKIVGVIAARRSMQWNFIGMISQPVDTTGFDTAIILLFKAR